MQVLRADLQDEIAQEQIISINIDLQSEGFVRHGKKLPADQEYLIRNKLVPGLIQHDFIVFLALEEDQPIGIAMCQRSYSTYLMRDCLVLQDLFVMANKRKLGVASKLMQTTEDFARDCGMCRVEFTTTPNNINAAMLYKKRGYKDASIIADGSFQKFLQEKNLDTTSPAVLLKLSLS